MRLNHLSASQPTLSRRTNRSKAIVAAATALVLTSSYAAAATTWANSATLDFGTAAAWLGGTPSASNAAFLPAAAAGTNPNVGATDVAALGLTINNSGGKIYDITSSGAGRLTLGAGGLSVSGGGTTTIAPGITLGADATFNIASSTTTILTGALNLAGNQLTKTGTGTLRITGPSTFTAPTTAKPVIVAEGTLQLTSTSALGAQPANTVVGAPAVTVKSGATLSFDAVAGTTAIAFGINPDPFGTIPANTGSVLTLEDGSTLTAQTENSTGAQVAIRGTYTPKIVNGATVTMKTLSTSVGLYFRGQLSDSAASGPTGSGSIVNVENQGTFQLSDNNEDGTITPGLAPSFTGTYNINNLINPADPGSVGIITATSFGAVAGKAAKVNISGGEFLVRDSGSTPIPNDLNLTNGVRLWAASDDGGQLHTFNGHVTMTGDADLFTYNGFGAGDNSDMVFNGKFSGNAAIFTQSAIEDGSAVFRKGGIRLANTATGSAANDFTGRFFLTENTILDASTTVGGSSPLGGTTTDASVVQLSTLPLDYGDTITDSTLRINLPSTPDKNDLQDFLYSNTAIVMSTPYSNAPSTGGRIETGPGTGGSATGVIVQLGDIVVFGNDPAGEIVIPNQTLTVASTNVASGYQIGFGNVFVDQQFTIVPDATSPIDVVIAGYIADLDPDGTIFEGDPLTGTFIKGGSNNLLVVASARVAGVSVQGGRMTMQFGGGMSIVKTLTIAGTSTVPTAAFDIALQGIAIDYDAATTPVDRKAAVDSVRNQIKAGKGTANGVGLFNYAGNGITSEIIGLLNADYGFNRLAIGFIDNQKFLELTGDNYDTYGELDSTTFEGVDVDDSSIIIAATYAGDANLDGVIDTEDYALINGGFAGTGAFAGYVSWLTGDFNLDGVINADDYAIIDFGFLHQGDPLHGVIPTTVPEPTSLALLGLGGAALMGRRRRQA